MESTVTVTDQGGVPIAMSVFLTRNVNLKKDIINKYYKFMLDLLVGCFILINYDFVKLI